MRVLLVEDKDEKAEDIEQVLQSLSSGSAHITRVNSIAAYVSERNVQSFDVEIIDLMLPYGNGGPPRDMSGELCSIMSTNKGADVIIAMSAYDDISSESRSRFAGLGLSVLKYCQIDRTWENAFRFLVEGRRRRLRFDFAILTALESEREGYMATSIELRQRSILRGLDVQFAQIGNLRGVLVCLPSMGPVSAATTTARVLQEFEVSFACMSGICAGYEGNARLGQVIVAKQSWDHQSGKLTPTGLKIAPDHIPIHESVRLLAKYTSELDAFKSQPDDFPETLTYHSPTIGPIVSGSSVLADGDSFDVLVSEQHRKIAGLDMEIYGFYRAVALTLPSIAFVAAKTVVDSGTVHKGDDFQSYGCKSSARFCVELIRGYFDGFDSPTP